jgi:uncharacterized protein (TIGR02145 family)
MVVQFKRFLFCLFIGSNAIGQIKDIYVDTRDNKEYAITTIGEQTWFAENIAFEISKGSWVYEKKTENLAIYGRLYSWKAACKVCPTGWRLPSLDDFKTLLKNINVADSLLYYETLVEGGKSSFNVKLAGWYAGRKFDQLNIHTDFWTSTIYQPFKGATKNAFRFSFYKKDKQVYWNPDYTDYGFSVRCIKD